MADLILEANDLPPDLWEYFEPVEVGAPDNVLVLGPEPFSARTMPTGYTEGETSTDHFAVMPTKLASFCIRAATSERGCCPSCGAGWVRVVERDTLKEERKAAGGWHPCNVGERADYHRGTHGNGRTHDLGIGAVQQLGWRPSCPCPPADPVPSVVLDPFGGAGTTGLVADRLGRDSILIELNESYASMARNRIYNDAPLFASVAD